MSLSLSTWELGFMLWAFRRRSRRASGHTFTTSYQEMANLHAARACISIHSFDGFRTTKNRHRLDEQEYSKLQVVTCLGLLVMPPTAFRAPMRSEQMTAASPSAWNPAALNPKPSNPKQ